MNLSKMSKMFLIFLSLSLASAFGQTNILGARTINASALVSATPIAGGVASPTPVMDWLSLQTLRLEGLSNLSWFAQKVRNKQPVVIAYLGGSITQGTGASNEGTSYRGISQKILVSEIQKRGARAIVKAAPIGGTGSQYGAYRIGSQLLNQNPDLLVVEFAVNDFAIPPREHMPGMIEGMEGIVRQALRKNPHMGIVFFYTTKAKFQSDYYAKGLLPESVAAHHQVAQHYGILEVHTGPIVEEGLKAGTYTEQSFFKDGIHPTDIGHALYAKALTDAILPALDLPPPAGEPVLPPLLGKGSLEYAHLDRVVPVDGEKDWTIIPNQWNWFGVPIYSCAQGGKQIRFLAKGKNIQLIYLGKLRVRWTTHGTSQEKVLDGKFGLPFPATYWFPADAQPEGLIIVEALADQNGKARGQVWGLFSVQAP